MAQSARVLIIVEVLHRITLICCVLWLASICACGLADSHDNRVVDATQSAPQSPASSPEDGVPDATTQLSPPIISVVVARGSNPFDNPGGVTFAAWADGRVMRSAFPERVTNWITQGRLSPAQLEQVRQATAMLRDHVEPKGHFCCSHMSVKILDGADKGTYTHQLANGRKSKPISEFVDLLWTLDIADGVRAAGADHGRFPNSGLEDICPDL